MSSYPNIFHHITFHFLTITHLIHTTTSQPQNYIVHMDSAAKPKPFTDHHTWFESALDSLSESSSSKLIYAYKHAISGFSASLTPTELEALKSTPGYLHSTRDSPITLDTTYTPAFLRLSPLSGAWPASEFGKDVVIGLVDTGVWPESESFDDKGLAPIPEKWKGKCQIGTQFNSSMCNNKLIGAQYFNKGLLATNPNLTVAMSSARDTAGHGTHTSSTAAGARVDSASYFGYAGGNATGIAPLARVAVYKALFDEGSSLADILAAIDAAIDDGVDVLSISLGNDVESLYDDVIAIATFAAVEKGIFVALSAGNNGPSWRSLHNGTPWALTVAAGTTDRQLGGTVGLGNGIFVYGQSLYPESIGEATLSLMDECDDIAALKRLRSDTFVVCFDINGTSVGDQVYNIGTTKVVGAIFISESTEVPLLIKNYYPAIFLDKKAGKVVMDYIKNKNSSENPTASINLQQTFNGAIAAPKVASYSSRGPSPTCPVVLKPDIMAPGDLILAAWTQAYAVAGGKYTKYNIDSGTSMSCPHAAGIAALLRGANPEWSAAMIRSAMMTTVDIVDSSNEQIRDIGRSNEASSGLAMGAGHVNPNKAMEPGLVYETEYQDYIDLVCGLNYTEEQMRVITRSSRTNCSRPSRTNCSRPSTDLNYPSFILIVPDGVESYEKVFWRTATNVGEGAATYDVKVTVAGGVGVRVEPERLVFTERYEKARFRVAVRVGRKMKGEVVDCSVSWVESQGKYRVRSPIVVSGLSDKID